MRSLFILDVLGRRISVKEAWAAPIFRRRSIASCDEDIIRSPYGPHTITVRPSHDHLTIGQKRGSSHSSLTEHGDSERRLGPFRTATWCFSPPLSGGTSELDVESRRGESPSKERAFTPTQSSSTCSPHASTEVTIRTSRILYVINRLQ